MQSFLPYFCFFESAHTLDNRRLNKQIQETHQKILHHSGIKPFKVGWIHHPAVLQWTGYLEALKYYQNVCIDEWLTRLKKDGSPIISNRDKYQEINWNLFELPWWLGIEEYHASHRANLLRKKPEHYSQFGWSEDPNTPYWWPSKEM